MVTVPLPIEYGPVPEEEERVPMRPDDASAPTVLVNAQVPDGEAPQPPPSYPTEDSRRGVEHTAVISTASEAKAQMSAQPQPYLHQHQQPHTQTSITMTTTNTVTSTATSTLTAKGPHITTQPGLEGGHINLAFTQGHPPEKEGHGGKNTSLWNPTYGSWFLQQRKQQQQQQQQLQRQGGVGGAGGSGGRVPGEGQEHVGRTVAEVAGALGLQHQHQHQLQHKQFQHQLQQQHQLQLLHHQQQQQQQGLCRPLLPPPPPPAAQSPLLLDSAALPPVPLYRLRRFPCGNIGYGYQEQGVPLDASHGNPNPPPPPPPPLQGTSMPPGPAHQRGASIPTSVSLGRSGISEDSRPLLVTMGTVQDPRLPRMEGHNATVL